MHRQAARSLTRLYSSMKTPAMAARASSPLLRVNAAISVSFTHAFSGARPMSTSSANEALKSDLADAHVLSHIAGMDELVWNHISARRSDNPSDMYITPFPCMWSQMTADRFNDIKKPEDGANVTAEVIHEAIYKGRPDVKCIVHTHSRYSLAVSCIADGLMFLTQDSAAFYGKVAYYDWQGMSDDKCEQDAIAAAFPESAHTLFMRNHGVITVGETVAEAWVRAWYLERVCQTQIDVLQTGVMANLPSRDVLLKTALQYEKPEFRHGAGEWSELKKAADRFRRGEYVRL